MAESQVNAGSALSKGKREVAGNESVDPGRVAQVSPPSDTQSKLKRERESASPLTKHRSEGNSAGQDEALELPRSEMESPCPHKRVRHPTKEDKGGSLGQAWEASGREDPWGRQAGKLG